MSEDRRGAVVGDTVIMRGVTYKVSAVNKEGWAILKPQQKEKLGEMMSRLQQHGDAKRAAEEDKGA